jgi:hypothetical protein
MSKLFTIRRQNLEALLITLDKMAKRAEYVIQAERMDGANIIAICIPRLRMVAEPCLDLVDCRIRVGNTPDHARRIPDFIHGPDQL